VVCGDPLQVDLPNPGAAGLADAVSKLENIPRIAMIRFGVGDVVRHPLVGRIVDAYEGPGR
jgi:phosphate starvation-inducible PhoH-like protein